VSSPVEVGQGIYMIDVQTGQKVLSCSAYLVLGERAALVETGPSSVVPDLLEGMRELDFDLSRLAYIIPTHIHLDHGGGVGALAREAPGAQVVVHERGARHLIDPSRLIASTRQVQGEAAYQAAGEVIPVPRERVWAVSGGEVVSLGNRDLDIIAAPGHAPHQICVFDRQTRGLFPGDAVGTLPPGLRRPIPAVVPPSFDMDQYLDTLRRLRELKPSVIYLSHLGVRTDVDFIFDATEEDLRACGRIMLEGMRAGQSRRELESKLKEYMSSVSGRRYQGSDTFGLLIPGFAMYFKGLYHELEMPK